MARRTAREKHVFVDRDGRPLDPIDVTRGLALLPEPQIGIDAMPAAMKPFLVPQ